MSLMEFRRTMSGAWTMLRHWEADKLLLAGKEVIQDGEKGAVYKICSNHLLDRFLTMCG